MFENEQENDETTNIATISKLGKASTMVPFTSKRRKSIIPTGFHGETSQEKENRMKEDRERRKSVLDTSHRHIFELVAQILQLDPSTVEEHVLDTRKGVEMCNKFIKKTGSRSLMFFYQITELPRSECGRVVTASAKTQMIPRIIVTNGKDVPLDGTCVYLIRIRLDIELTTENIPEEIFCGQAELNQQTLAGFLTAVCESLEKFYKPCIKNSKHWGELGSTLHDRPNRKDFMDTFDHFYNFFEECRKDIQCQATLKESAILDLSQVKNVHDCINLANNPQKLALIEELVLTWSKQIELVLAESEQMRKEADDTGPLAELEHWRHLVTKFSSVIEQINGHDCKMVIHTLVAAKSKVLKVWKELDARITDAFNEARDNVKFLYTLERFCEPLYKGQLETMQAPVSCLINAIRMIHAVSRCYNTSERMTSLFVKVTNQMVTSCKQYITNGGLSCIWDQSPKKVIEKLKCCQRLYHDYQDNFKYVKKKIRSTPGAKSFEFSEMYVFGKYEAFCKRLDKITELLNIIETYSVLSNFHIEGIEFIVAKFLHICSAIKNKPYDNLDPRKLDFDNDFEDFKQQIADLKDQLQQFLNRNFQDITSTTKAIQLLQRFEKLCIPGLDIESKYSAILEHYREELEYVSQLYNQQKDNPPYPRTMSPFAGRIAWVKHLFKKINEPMEFLKVYLPSLNSKDVLGIVHKYNKVAQILVHFELLYHMAWKKQVETIGSSLQVTILVAHPETKDIYVNFDPLILQTINEAQRLLKMDLDIPDTVVLLCLAQKKLKSAYCQTKVTLFHRITKLGLQPSMSIEAPPRGGRDN
ncbi:dynein axonemal heavy chain 8-like [Tachypleus tridentatus]|uniref:dynein axonemal heavy chain 8-like n=1 Tax=Tachypleus tridentatus TaxID=6853 RepID=UPI003FD62C48